MKKLISILPICILLSSVIQAQIKHEIKIINQTPEWAKNLSEINLGTYYDYLQQENPIEKIIAIMYMGDREIGIKPPYPDFLYIIIDNNPLFLKFSNRVKKGAHYLNTYSDGVVKIILDYNGQRVSSSGNGDGGILYFYYDNKLIKKINFWATI
jgi:hypothetical protein